MIEFLNIFEIVARGGGGGSSGGGGAGGAIVIPIIIIGAIIGWYKRRKKIKKAKQDLTVALSSDSSWSEAELKKRTEEVFYKFQDDWSHFNIESMKSYLTKDYLRHMHLVMLAIHQLGRRNVMHDVKLSGTTLLEVKDHHDDEEDRFSIEIVASATDQLIAADTEQILKSNLMPFKELWHFEREGSTWLLEGISQASEGITGGYGKPKNEEYMDFAKRHKCYYNEDFGWLLLPYHGSLFGESRFDTSDINHHVIGQHKSRVVQFFEYIPVIESKQTITLVLKRWIRREKRMKASKYTVAQITLPKSYGGIVIERRGLVSIIGLAVRPKGMQKMSYAPVAFGKKFDVYATDQEQVTSFELLHPAYLEKLVNLTFEVDIEVFGDNLYLYSSDSKADYDEMYTLLTAAYKELER